MGTLWVKLESLLHTQRYGHRSWLFNFFFVYCSFGYSITYSVYVYLSREKGAFYWSIKFVNTTFKAVSDSKVVEPIPQSQNNSLGQRKYLWLPFKAA